LQVAFDPTNAEERAKVRDLIAAYDAGDEVLADEYDDDASENEAEAEVAEDAIDPNRFVAAAGDGSLQFVEEAVEHLGVDVDFTFEELSDRSDIDVETLKSYHRNLARTAIYCDGTISDLIPSWWDGKRVHYKIPAALWEAHRAKRGVA